VKEQPGKCCGAEALLVLHAVKHAAALGTSDFIALEIFLVGNGNKQGATWFEDTGELGENVVCVCTAKMFQNFD